MVVQADARALPLREGSVQCVITSPPYWRLRDYGTPGQIGLEPTPDAYVAALVAVCREVRRVLHDDGTLWLVMGDSFNDKQLVGIPWRVAFDLQADGWYLRQDIIWHKPNPMPESVTDRCTKAHEYIFLLTKSQRYYFDALAISEPLDSHPHPPLNRHTGRLGKENAVHEPDRVWGASGRRNKRSVWSVTTSKYAGAHYATFPPKLIEPMILAGCPLGGLVCDPFAGSGTVLEVAARLGRRAVGCDLTYHAQSRVRTAQRGLPLHGWT